MMAQIKYVKKYVQYRIKAGEGGGGGGGVVLYDPDGSNISLFFWLEFLPVLTMLLSTRLWL